MNQKVLLKGRSPGPATRSIRCRPRVRTTRSDTSPCGEASISLTNDSTTSRWAHVNRPRLDSRTRIGQFTHPFLRDRLAEPSPDTRDLHVPFCLTAPERRAAGRHSSTRRGLRRESGRCRCPRRPEDLPWPGVLDSEKDRVTKAGKLPTSTAPARLPSTASMASRSSCLPQRGSRSAACRSTSCSRGVTDARRGCASNRWDSDKTADAVSRIVRKALHAFKVARRYSAVVPLQLARSVTQTRAAVPR